MMRYRMPGGRFCKRKRRNSAHLCARRTRQEAEICATAILRPCIQLNSLGLSRRARVSRVDRPQRVTAPWPFFAFRGRRGHPGAKLPRGDQAGSWDIELPSDEGKRYDEIKHCTPVLENAVVPSENPKGMRINGHASALASRKGGGGVPVVVERVIIYGGIAIFKNGGAVLNWFRKRRHETMSSHDELDFGECSCKTSVREAHSCSSVRDDLLLMALAEAASAGSIPLAMGVVHELIDCHPDNFEGSDNANG